MFALNTGAVFPSVASTAFCHKSDISWAKRTGLFHLPVSSHDRDSADGRSRRCSSCVAEPRPCQSLRQPFVGRAIFPARSEQVSLISKRYSPGIAELRSRQLP